MRLIVEEGAFAEEIAGPEGVNPFAAAETVVFDQLDLAAFDQEHLLPRIVLLEKKTPLEEHTPPQVLKELPAFVLGEIAEKLEGMKVGQGDLSHVRLLK